MTKIAWQKLHGKNCMANLHGKIAWQNCMAKLNGRMHGKIAWQICMAKLHGKIACIGSDISIKSLKRKT